MTGELNILRAGKVFEAWIDRPAHKLKVAELSIERARALRDLYAQAVTEAQLVQAVAHGIINGSVCVYDLVALPLFNHFGPPLFLVYMQERERKFSLIEAMFQATTEGLVALAVVRDAAGAPIDFQIAALNEVAVLVMQGTAEGLRGRHLSEVCDEIQASQMLPRLVSVFNGGGSAHFELECPLDDQKHLRVGVVTMGDLLAVTLTDISGLIAQQKSFRLLFEGNPVPMWLFDLESMKFLTVNDAAIAQYGYDRESFLKLTLLDIVPQRDRDAIEQAVRNKPGAGGRRLHEHFSSSKC